MKLLVKSFLIVLILQLSNFAQASEYTIRWKINHTPVEYFLKAVNTFKKNVEQKSKGRVTVEAVLPEGDQTIHDAPRVSAELLKSVKAGRAEMGQVYTSNIANSISKEFNVFDLPFLFENHEHATKVLDYSIGKTLLASLNGSGVKGLGFTYSGGFLVQVSQSKEIHKYEDMKGTTNKTFGGYLTTASLKELGAIEQNRVEQDAKVRGVDLYSSTYADLEDVLIQKNNNKAPKLINETQHRLLATTLVINEKFFNKLPKDLQKIVIESAQIAAVEERKNIVNGSLKVRNQILKSKIPIVTLSTKEKSRWRSHLAPVYQKFYKDIKGGKDLVQKIQAAKI